MTEEKRIQAGNEGEELVPGVTENLSSASHMAANGEALNAKLRSGGEQRGRAAGFDRETGAVTGSGQRCRRRRHRRRGLR